MPLRAMTYNIKTGGQDGGDTGRLDQVMRVVAACRPDVLALQELRGFRSGGRMDLVAEDLGMRAFLAPSWFGQPVAVLVRSPLRVLRAGAVLRPFHHAAARVVVDTRSGPLTVISTHLHPYSGNRRLREAGWLARQADPRRMVLLMGDLNTLDPWTGHSERISRLPPSYRIRHLMPGDPSTVDTRAVAALDRAGFVDLCRQAPGGGKDYTAPTSRGGGPEFSGMRLDYVLGTAPVARLVRSCRVVDGGEAECASDHYPVVAEFDLDATG